MTNQMLAAIYKSATDLASALRSDSGIEPKYTVGTLAEALARDMQGRAISALPTKGEITLMVQGDDEGDVPPELRTRFKNTCEAIGKFF